MAFISKLAKFATSPQGKKVFAEAQRLAKDPETRRKIDGARKSLGSRGKPGPRP